MASRLAVLAKTPLEDVTGNDLAFLIEVAKAASQVRIAQNKWTHGNAGSQPERNAQHADMKAKESELDALLAEQAKVTEDLFD